MKKNPKTTLYQAQNANSITALFSRIAPRYDLINSIISLGIHHRWKRQLVKMAYIQSDFICCDGATGTGDIAFLMDADLEKYKLKRSGKVYGIDFCAPMLQIAKKKSIYYGRPVEFREGDLMSIPFEADSFDVFTVSFGIRNVANYRTALLEIYRVLKPNGICLILEFGQPSSNWLKKLYTFYAKHIIPKVGAYISGDKSAYEYLQSSSAEFPCAGIFTQNVKESTPFKNVSFEPLHQGIAYIYTLKKT